MLYLTLPTWLALAAATICWATDVFGSALAINALRASHRVVRATLVHANARPFALVLVCGTSGWWGTLGAGATIWRRLNLSCNASKPGPLLPCCIACAIVGYKPSPHPAPPCPQPTCSASACAIHAFLAALAGRVAFAAVAGVGFQVHAQQADAIVAVGQPCIVRVLMGSAGQGDSWAAGHLRAFTSHMPPAPSLRGSWHDRPRRLFNRHMLGAACGRQSSLSGMRVRPRPHAART